MVARALFFVSLPAALGLQARGADEDEARARRTDQDGEQVTEYRFIPDPVPETFEQVRSTLDKAHARDSHGSKLVAVQENGLLGGRNVTIMGYPPEEDEEISGALQNTGGAWETFHMAHLCDPWQEEGARGYFLDVGANVGTYTLPMADCIRGKGSVISVEGMPSIAQHLRAGIVKNEADNVILYNYALGGKTTANSVNMQLDDLNKGASSVMGNKPGETGVEQVVVPLTNLDAMLHQDPRMKALLSAKVDIEGNEGRMLRGATELFTNYPPCYLVIELIAPWLDSAGTPIEAIVPLLRRNFSYKSVPGPVFIRHSRWRAKTIHIYQKDLEGCKQRVAAEYAKIA